MPANLQADAFAGTAADYARYRPPYPEALLAEILARAERPPDGRLLDLACGPGRLALPLASRFSEVWAVDLEPEMIAVGRAEAAARGVANIVWSVGRAEDLAAPAAAFDLVTIGEAFHRLDQARIAALAIGWLKPGGALVTLGGVGPLNGDEPWQHAIADLAREWTKPAFPNGWAEAAPGADGGLAGAEVRLRAAGFADVQSHDVVAPLTWTSETIAGYLRSTSVCSARVLGERQGAFEAAQRAALLALDPAGVFREDARFGYTLARKPL
ncbi:MAG TPA: class I SAM-dependent methyltransferase [Caulobacteraceae bacterium]|nr:class I SAM-dependent methyltransferase [Caulobacteraceae bacterium]